MKYALILILCLTAGWLRAQETPVAGGWTLEACMQYAVEHSPQTATQEARNAIHRENYREAIASLMPSVSAQTNAYFNFGRGLDVDNTYKNINSLSNNYSLGGSLTLFEGLSGINRVKMERVNRLMGRHEFDTQRDMLAYAVMEAFVQVQYYREAASLAAEQLAESESNLAQTRRMAEVGLKGFPDVAEMEAKQAADRYNLTRQQNLLQVAVIVLKEKMNFPVEEELAVGEYIPDEPVGKTTRTALDIYEEGLDVLPQALAAESALDASQLAYRATRGSLWPALSMGAGISTNYFQYRNQDNSTTLPYWDQFREKRGEYVNFTLSIPIFNGLRRSSSVRRSRYQVEIARNQRDETLRSLYGEIEQAVADMNGLADEYTQAHKQAESAATAHNVNQRKYEEGLVSALELHTSSNRLLSARIEEQYARLRYHLKQRLVEYYTGRPFIETNNQE